MTMLTRIFYFGYAGMLLAVGGSGILIARWELSRVFAVDLAGMGAAAAATLLNQYRFLKTTELAFGAFCMIFRREIFSGGRERALFFAGLWVGVGARILSMLLDGVPHWAFLAFAALEATCGALMIAARPGKRLVS